MTEHEADGFVAEWMEAWNSHDVERILEHYVDDVEYYSPFVARRWSSPRGPGWWPGRIVTTGRQPPSLRAVMEPSGPSPEPPLTFDDGIDSARFRTILGHFATGVTVVTGHGPDGPSGLAANSFTAVSLDPPLVLVCMAHTSTTWPSIRDSGHFAVNILGEHQEEICRRFGARSGDRFEGVGWQPGKTGSPVLHEAIAYVDCVIDAQHEAGDHVIVVGRVVDLGQPAEGGPLLFWRGGYARLGQ